ncbi:HAMP domain-containing sensor histidine kinase [Paenibacillus sp.]|jgi:signal transduction histidine kinase|uniref:sensor histidine kinase n=1 Tax=Paenibacillus sp. TaxID=58172 RepID=UPI00281F1E2E|nr:HAMP domain-containing sensor histidine kinase [Paenibacillus sp.]MDR0270788.1 HAMP domain-containing histidine kinase [Paenibacillus sp.]
MRRIRTRLTLHFTYQVLLLWVIIVVSLIIMLLALINYLVNKDLKRTFSTSALDGIQAETLIDHDKVKMNERWSKMLGEQGYWLQIINESGSVIYSTNTTADLKNSYGAAELLNIQETRRLGSYYVVSSLASDADGPRSVLFLMGTLDLGTQQLKEWFQQYNSGGIIRPGAETELERQHIREDDYLQIVDAAGQILQSVGKAGKLGTGERYHPLDLVSVRAEPGRYPMKLSSYYDETTGNTWLLHQGKPNMKLVKQTLFREIMVILIVIGAAVMVLTLAISIWHGYRYGQPLMLFAGWFERMSQGRYSEALTEKERKRVFRRNGKIRMRYRLYKEVIAGFYEMATKLDASQRERKMLEQTREEWMTGISHDLRTPLSTIQGYGHLLESGQFTWNEAELKEMGRMIREKGDFMLELLQDFSLTFQLKNNAIQFPLEPIELNEFVRRSVLRYVNDATIDTASFSFEEWGEDLTIMANPKWFQRMLDNIIINAVKHNPEGTEISVRTGEDGENAWISVSDNGRGMDEETRRNLFERYYRGTSTDETTEGAGLGMSIAHAIVIAHQGHIRVNSNPQQGTEVIMEFPLIP